MQQLQLPPAEGVALPGHVQSLTAHHSRGTGGSGQGGYGGDDALRGQLCLGQLAKGRREQAVTRQNGRGLAVYHMVGGAAPAELVVVHGGQIVVNEGIGVDHLHAAGEGQGILHPAAAHAAGLQGQHRPDPLASGQQGILHGLLHTGIAGVLAEQLRQTVLDQGPVPGQNGFKILFHYGSSPVKGCSTGRPSSSAVSSVTFCSAWSS